MAFAFLNLHEDKRLRPIQGRSQATEDKQDCISVRSPAELQMLQPLRLVETLLQGLVLGRQWGRFFIGCSGAPLSSAIVREAECHTVAPQRPGAVGAGRERSAPAG